ncbi:hypothetical protein TYRP_005731 [Tyrophagus putrescentiae]|nr:hypothetical protein TYRP_005731 [Tyrophagus putrescentiae]
MVRLAFLPMRSFAASASAALAAVKFEWQWYNNSDLKKIGGGGGGGCLLLATKWEQHIRSADIE